MVKHKEDIEKSNSSVSASLATLRTDSVSWLKSADPKVKQTFRGWTLLFLAYQSVGVIYGDIGTSPLYVYSSTFSSDPAREEILGALSMIIWTLTLIVTIKYVFFVLRADDIGEGGTFALYSLLSRYMNIAWRNPSKLENIEFARYPTNEMKKTNAKIRSLIERSFFIRRSIAALSLIGVSMVIGDGILTPAQSVLGAVQGLKISFPNISQSVVLGVAVVILILLFLIQPFGTSKIAVFFAPVVILWLILNFCVGIYNLVIYDYTVLQAFSPYWCYVWFSRNPTEGWINMGGILLSFTGVEALFADLGHFSQLAIQISWTCFACPCLLLAYIGQAAYISINPSAYANPFFASLPSGLFWPSFVIATLATIVASQAMITGCFSIVNQAIALSNLPGLKVVHTSKKFHGQIYIPVVNWLLMIGTGNAYGACVAFVTLITTILVTIVSLVVWRWNIVFSTAFFFVFGLIEGAYLSATLFKIPQGAWFTIALAAIISSIMFIWNWGKTLQWRYEEKKSTTMTALLSVLLDANRLDFANTNKSISRLGGLAVVFDPSGFNVPLVFNHFISNFNAVHEVVIFLHYRHLSVPTVPPSERILVFATEISHFYRVIVRLGYNDSLYDEDDPATLIVERLTQAIQLDKGKFRRYPIDAGVNPMQQGGEVNAIICAKNKHVTYVLGMTEFVPAPDSNILKRALLNVFNFLRKNAHSNKRITYGIPNNQLVQVGMIHEL
ncbi:uncharacterized protein VTP21DRAFT_1903 [Calcarisporiella thermophila]|uniref:uncharacterized protein n=1 Tax=Calcarisporiella thermophila TaxID=911321 RepID=UPI0037423F46